MTSGAHEERDGAEAWLEPARAFEPRFGVGDLNVLRDHGTSRARALVALVDSLLTELRSARSALEAASQDAARLDWIDEHRAFVHHVFGWQDTRFAFKVEADRATLIGRGVTIREAIDAASTPHSDGR